MTIIDFKLTGKTPFRSEDASAMQDNMSLLNKALSKTGEVAILEGCKLTGTEISAGIMAWQGTQIVEFEGGQKNPSGPTKIKLVTTYETVTSNGVVYQNYVAKSKAVIDNTNGFWDWDTMPRRGLATVLDSRRSTDNTLIEYDGFLLRVSGRINVAIGPYNIGQVLGSIPDFWVGNGRNSLHCPPLFLVYFTEGFGVSKCIKATLSGNNIIAMENVTVPPVLPGGEIALCSFSFAAPY